MEPRTIDKLAAHQTYKLKDGTKVPGGSTIASVAGSYWSKGPLLAWANAEGQAGRGLGARDAAAESGVLCHFLVETYLKKEPYNIDNFSAECQAEAMLGFNKFVAWWDEQQFTHLHSELQLVSEQYRFGGTIDLLANTIDGQVVLIDIKTNKSIHDEAFIQVSGYGLLAAEYGLKPDKYIIARVGKTEDPDDQEFIVKTDMAAYQKMFLLGLELYNAHAAIKKGKK